MGVRISIIFIAYLLDLILGDPQWYWHPVRIIGRLIAKLEGKLNTGKFNRKFSGIISVVLITGLVMFIVWLVLRLANFIHPVFYYVLSVLFIYFALSVKSLASEVNKVYTALKSKNIREARANLALIVGRDTQNLEEPQIIRGTVETAAESAMDGIIAPLFYAFLGGPVLVWAYKAINTLDSMVGHRNERYASFGMASAKIDGMLNFIPAKITCFLISIASLFFRKDCVNSLKYGLKYFFKGQEFNSIAAEAAMAGALGVQLGGVSFYDSLPVEKPLVGNHSQPLAIKHIRESIQITYLSALLFIFIGIISFYLLSGRR